MKHYLITTEPVALVARQLGGSPPTRDIVEGQTVLAPEGHYYIPDLPRPIAGQGYDPDTQRIERAEPALEGYGWRIVDLTAEEIAARNPILPVTKLTLMRRLLEIGKWSTFKGMLSQLPEEVQDAWTLAQDIRRDDPLFIAHEAEFKAGLELTDEQFETLLKP